MKNVLMAIANKIIPGLNFLLLGKYRLLFALWAFFYLTFLAFWFLICLFNGSNILCWLYIITMFGVNIGCGYYKPRNGGEPNFKVEWKKKAASVALIVLSIVAFEKMNFGVQYGVVSMSMEPTLQIGERIISDPFSLKYFGKPIARHDVVVHKKPGDDRTLFIHRVLGIPGDIIKIVRGDIYLNGNKLEEDKYKVSEEWKRTQTYGSQDWQYRCSNGYLPKEVCSILQAKFQMIMDSVTWKLGQEQYFLLGDNVENSVDSRFYGLVPKKDITAKAICFGFNLADLTPSGLAKMGTVIK